MEAENIRLLGYGIGGLLFLALLYLRFRRMSRLRPLKVEWMWVRPAIMAIVCGFVLYRFPPQAADLVWLGAALVLGALIGWQRGRFVRIVVDPETHAINQQASPAAMAFLIAILAARMLLRQEAVTAWHVNAVLITDLSIVFVLGLFTVQQLEMWLRARKLLRLARLAREARSA